MIGSPFKARSIPVPRITRTPHRLPIGLVITAQGGQGLLERSRYRSHTSKICQPCGALFSRTLVLSKNWCLSCRWGKMFDDKGKSGAGVGASNVQAIHRALRRYRIPVWKSRVIRPPSLIRYLVDDNVKVMEENRLYLLRPKDFFCLSE